MNEQVKELAAARERLTSSTGGAKRSQQKITSSEVKAEPGVIRQEIDRSDAALESALSNVLTALHSDPVRFGEIHQIDEGTLEKHGLL